MASGRMGDAYIDGYHTRLPCMCTQADERDTAAELFFVVRTAPQGGIASASELGARTRGRSDGAQDG